MNKFFVSVIVPTINLEFNFFIPNNKKIGVIKFKICELIKNDFGFNDCYEFFSCRLLDRYSGVEYDNDILINNSNIQNGSKLILL